MLFSCLVMTMAVFLVKVAPEQIEQIERIISDGGFRDVEQFISVAIRNQLSYEAPEPAPKRSPAKQTVSDAAVPDTTPANLDAYAWRGLGDGPRNGKGIASKNPLWGQYYRYLPLKAVARLAAGQFRRESFELPELGACVRSHIMSLVQYVDKEGGKQKFGMKLDVGFPSGKRDIEKSMERFIVQYVGRISAGGVLTGFPCDMGFLKTAGTGSAETLCLTDQALEFASLPNPILDQRTGNLPLSDEEVSYLLGHIVTSMPGEASHMREITRLIGNGVDDPGGLDGALAAFYTQEYKADSSDKARSLMRSGCISRLVEMGILIRTNIEGRRVYTLVDTRMGQMETEFGRNESVRLGKRGT